MYERTPTLVDGIPSVGSVIAEKEMVRINARTNVTSMAHQESIGNLTDR
jgi:hypothetical protein